ncbi:MAG: AAA family ATPase [Bacteroidetes bacterium 4572_117]|nr:MAG: AAA family ATPase [Bacteroidetes bacterium 4572_117]
MANEDIDKQENNGKIELETGTYEIIRHRLDKHGKELRDKLNILNDERRKVFGSADASLIATERIITDNNCVPADMFPVGNQFIFGYNVSVRLRGVSVEDVFTVYSYKNHSFKKEPHELLSEKTFLSDFNDLYKYFEKTRFVKFSRIGVNLYMIFRIGNTPTDIKVFKWIIADDKLRYIDNRSEHEFKFPKQHEFKWKKATREMHVKGEHPHVSIENILFVETTEGDLTIKAENNTDSGKGVYAEEVDDPDQTLDDADFYYSVLGNIIILKIRPYHETYRYIVYSSKTQSAVRIDAIENACVFLPENQGIIFANGYYLQTGDYKFFDSKYENLIFEKRIISPNGEDFIYTFYEENTGAYFLLKYNIIEQQIEIPIICNGYSIFSNGEMCNFRDDGEAKKHHVIQIWKTTFFDADYSTVVDKKSYLFKIGNKDLVKGIAECRELLTLLAKDDTYTNLYLELVKKTTTILDGHYWITRKETQALDSSLLAIKEAAASAIDEFEKVSKIKKSTANQTEKITTQANELFETIDHKKLVSVDEFVSLLTELRTIRGELISLKQLRYVKIELVDDYEKKAEGYGEKLSENCIALLIKDESLNPYIERVEEISDRVGKITKVIEADEVNEDIGKVSAKLELLIEIVSNLKIKDAVQTAQIIDNISFIYSSFNKIKAELKRKRSELFLVEGRAEFTSQIKLISQAVINYLDLCDTPEKTDEYLTKLLVQLEELEGKFTEFDEFINEISIKREEIHDAFEQRKIQLVEKRSKRADTLQQSANRILKAVGSRISKLKTVSEINGYFATDLMIEKVRDIVKELIEIDDNVKADEIESRLKTVREDTVRQLKDKSELFVDGENIIKFGNHNFTVNTQPLGLSMVNRSGEMYFHLSGTGFYEKVYDENFYQLESYWSQSIISENDEVYRAEYLAYKTLVDNLENNEISCEEIRGYTQEQILTIVQNFMSVRYAEGYVKGIHDNDATIILSAIINIRKNADLLRYSSNSRACAEIWYKIFLNKDDKNDIYHQLKGAASILEVFPGTNGFKVIIGQINTHIAEFIEKTSLFEAEVSEEAAEYIFYELTRGDTFVINGLAVELYNEFHKYLKANNQIRNFNNSLNSLNSKPILKFQLIRNWLNAYIYEQNAVDLEVYSNEVAVTVFTESLNEKQQIDVALKIELSGFEGSHNLISGQKYSLDYNSFIRKLKNFDKKNVPAFREYLELKKQLTENFEDEMRLNEFKPRVMSSFVRNKLIDRVYLPLIGSNLAKQIGTAGEGKRTDLMGMLLLISPPGYGKTTLMEYVANRLGIIFMKINGPALGHTVISVDPDEAPNATAREELEKLNLAFEIGDNVMIYLDDIQHCNPEFLQKFISMADAQRKIEGVYKGKTKTYDFRGKKVCVIMAGNPYTESGDKFRIPDMLANRADIYNLGDILGDTEEEFLLSYIENSLSSNLVLGKLAGKSRKDVYTLIELIESGNKEGVEYETNHTAEEINDYTSVLEKMLKIREVVSLVNQQYIYSAAQADAYRQEPPFKLQGSYRDMNKLAEKVLPIMNEKELQTLILSHYENESQTLTSGAEANLLKFKEITNILSNKEKERRENIIGTYMKNKQADSGSQIALIANQMNGITNGLTGIRDVLKND